MEKDKEKLLNKLTKMLDAGEDISEALKAAPLDVVGKLYSQEHKRIQEKGSDNFSDVVRWEQAYYGVTTCFDKIDAKKAADFVQSIKDSTFKIDKSSMEGMYELCAANCSDGEFKNPNLSPIIFAVMKVLNKEKKNTTVKIQEQSPVKIAKVSSKEDGETNVSYLASVRRKMAQKVDNVLGTNLTERKLPTSLKKLESKVSKAVFGSKGR